MNFQQLEYVIAVDQLKKFGEAADKCHVTQATLSAMIIKLEAELGYKLFDRSKQPIRTTELGQTFIPIATEILQQRDELFHLNESEHVLKGSLRLGIIPTIATSVLPLWLPRLAAEFPLLDVQIREITTEEIGRALLRDEIDLGFMSTPYNDERIHEHILYYEPMVVYGHPEPNRSYISTKDLQEGKLWLLEEGHCFREQVLTLCELQSSSKLKENVQFKASSFDTLIGLAEGTGGMTLLPELYTKNLAPKRLSKISHFSSPYPVREVSLVCHRPASKTIALEQIGRSLKKCIEPYLSTNQLPKNELQIIGF